MNSHKSLNKILKILLISVVLITFQSVLTGCAGKYPTFDRDAALTDKFESSQILPDYRYYISGSFYEPSAILGVHKNYTLGPGLWREINVSPERMYQWITQIQSSWEARLYYTHYGSYIKDLNGETMGIWFSNWDWAPIWKSGEKEVTIYTPTHEPFYFNYLASSIWMEHGY